MNFRLTVALVVVLVVLAAAVYAVQQTGQATPTPAIQSIPVLSFLSSDVSELAATGQGKTTVAARDAQGRWTLKQPEEAPADQARLDSLVSRLSALTATRSIDSPGNLAEFGLDQPKVEAKVTLKSGQALALLLGDVTPDRAAYYAKLPDKNVVYLIPVSVGSDLNLLLTNPPKATPTPTPLPTAPAPAGTPTAVGTPAPAGTPTPKP